jgi:hypothetical protein
MRGRLIDLVYWPATDKSNLGFDSTRVYKKQLDKWGYRKYNSRKQIGDQVQIATLARFVGCVEKHSGH